MPRMEDAMRQIDIKDTRKTCVDITSHQFLGVYIH